MKFFDALALSKFQLIGLFILKVLAGLLVYIVYTHYYTSSDFHLYFNNSKIIFDRFLGKVTPDFIPGWDSNFDENFYNNSRVIIYANFLLQFFSFNNIYVHILSFCFLSFIGLTALYKSFLKYFYTKKTILFFGIYVVPSVLFWSSGIFKESIALFCLGLIVYLSDFGLVRKISLLQTLFLLLLLFILFFIKIYLFISIIPLLSISCVVSKTGKEWFLIKYFFLFFLFLLIIHFVSQVNDRLNVYQIVADRQLKAISEAEGGVFLENEKNFIRLDYEDKEALIMQPDSTFKIREGTDYLSWELNNMKDTTSVLNSSDVSSFQFSYEVAPAKSVVEIKRMEPTLLSFYKSIPSAIFNVFAQPTLLRITNIFHFFSWMENMFLLLLVGTMALFPDRKMFAYMEIFLFCALFGLIQFSIIGLTTPVIGAMVRYKVIVLPFLFTSILLWIDFKAIFEKIKRSRD